MGYVAIQFSQSWIVTNAKYNYRIDNILIRSPRYFIVQYKILRYLAYTRMLRHCMIYLFENPLYSANEHLGYVIWTLNRTIYRFFVKLV